MTEKCPTCRAPAVHEGERYQFDSSQYHMDAVKKLSEISALRAALIESEKRTLELTEGMLELVARDSEGPQS